MLAAMPMSRVEVDRGSGLRGGRLWWLALALGLLLRLWFMWHPMPLDPDTDVYANLATNLFHHGIYGISEGDLDAGGTNVAGTNVAGPIDPTLIRLPGYPLFLAAVFALFGTDSMTAVLLVQVAIDLLGCWLIASFVRDQVSVRAGTIAIFLAALCPFTAAYSTIALTECLSVFAVSLALWATGRVLRAQAEGDVDRVGMALASVAMAMAMLLRPDGALLAAAVPAAIVWYAWRQGRLRTGVKTALLRGLLAALPLVPWTLRNWRTFHVVQPLAPRRVNDPGEYVNYGFYRWMSTWSVDIVSTGNVFWKVGTEGIDVGDLPARAFDSPAQRAETAELLAEYNVGKTVPPALDAKFGALASERVRAHPVLCRVWVPALRVADMLLRPRTETLGLDADWWNFAGHHAESAQAVGLGLLNLALMIAALVGAVRIARDKVSVPWIALVAIYFVLRCALLSTMENSEPRYTLEMFPMLIACAACAFGPKGIAGGKLRAAAMDVGQVSRAESPT
jgi:4-amino-4-deoxy-L-arabinose transferase-like glycosyltransferase